MTSRNDRIEKIIPKLSDPIAELEQLRDEMENWKDSMEYSNKENSDKYSEVFECFSILEIAVQKLEDAQNELSDLIFPTARG